MFQNLAENIELKMCIRDMIEAAEEYRAGIRIFFDVLDEIYMIFGNEKMSFERYNKILQIGIAQSEFEMCIIDSTKITKSSRNIQTTYKLL